MLTVVHTVYSYPRLTESWITTQLQYQRRWPQQLWTQR